MVARLLEIVNILLHCSGVEFYQNAEIDTIHTVRRDVGCVIHGPYVN